MFVFVHYDGAGVVSGYSVWSVASQAFVGEFADRASAVAFVKSQQ